MLKDKLFSSGEITERSTNNGKFNMLTKLKQNKLRDSMRSLECTATDHSTSDQDFQ
jgi:hypothetical protein